MEAPQPATPCYKKIKDFENINFIEEINIKKNNNVYRIQFGINKLYKDEMTIKITSNLSKEYLYYYNKFNLLDIHNLSKVFQLYDNIKDIIIFLKNSKCDILEKNDKLIIEFNYFLPNGENKKIQLDLKKIMLDTESILNYLIEENKKLKQIISKNNNDILFLRQENKLLWEEINKLKNSNTNNKIKKNNPIDSKIINSVNDIGFILNYIRNNDKSFDFKSINLLYRASRDSDRTDICHKLCDNKNNIIIIIKSETEYIFGGYCKIGFKANKDKEYKIDNHCFLFSINLKKIYPVKKDKNVICYTSLKMGLCFYSSLGFYDHFFNNSKSFIGEEDCKLFFENIPSNNEINGGQKNFKCKELEVFQLK